MEKESLSFRRVFSIFLSSLVLISCGGQTLSNYEILKFEGEASGEEIPVATYDFKNIVFGYKNADSPFSATELYVALDYSSENIQGRHLFLDVEEYCYFFPELETGRFQSASVSFEYSASVSLEDGIASSISGETASVGTIQANDTTYVEGFLDAAANGLKGFLATYQEYRSKTEKWLLDKLNELGYEMTTYDQEWRDNFSSVIYEEYGITVDMKKLYQSGSSNDPNFVQMIVFANEAQAASYYYKRWGQAGNGQYGYHAHTGSIFFYTKSYDTFQATFPPPGN